MVPPEHIYQALMSSGHMNSDGPMERAERRRVVVISMLWIQRHLEPRGTAASGTLAVKMYFQREKTKEAVTLTGSMTGYPMQLWPIASTLKQYFC